MFEAYPLLKWFEERLAETRYWFALYSLFGRGVPQDLSRAQTLLREVFHKKDGIEHPNLERLKALITTLPHNQEYKANRRALEDVDQRALQVISRSLAGPYEHEMLQLLKEHYKNPAVNELTYCAWRIVIREGACAHEPDCELPYWFKRFHGIHARLQGTTIEKTYAALRSWGPNYNYINDHGYPVLGVAPDPGGKPSRHAHPDEYLFTPEPGITAFTGLTGRADGTIEFHGCASNAVPALLLPQDFEVLKILVFGDTEPTHPELNIRHLIKHPEYSGDVRVSFQYKEWGPKWLENTDVGATLYATDRILGQLAWGADALIDAPKHVNVPEFARAFVDAIRLSDSPKPGPASKRVELHPRQIDFVTEIQTNAIGAPTYVVAPIDVQMQIAGDYDLEPDRFLNDDMYRQGRLANILTKRFNELAGLLPIFERHRQLCGVFHSLVKLHELGFRPNADELQRLSAARKTLETVTSPLSTRTIPCAFKYDVHYIID